MISRIRRALLLGGCGASILVASGAAAQAWPQRPIRLIVPYPVGGLTDNISRTLGEEVGRLLGQNVIIENRAGAGGKVGMDLIRQAPPDGYTIGLATTAAMVTLPLTNPNYGIKPQDFELITLAVRTHRVLVVSEQMKVRSLKEFIAYAKQHPNSISYGIPGVGTSFHFGAALLQQTLGIGGVQVSYTGEGPMLTDLASGQIQYGLTGNSSSGLFATGKLVPIAVAARERIVTLPDVPTFMESGIDYTSGAWNGFVAPKGVPGEILDRLNAAFLQALQSPKVQQTFRTMGFTPDGTSRQEFARVILEDTHTYSGMLRSGAVKLNE